MKHRGVGDDHDLHMAQSRIFLCANGQFHRLFEPWIGRRLAIAAKGNVLHLTQWLGDAGKGGMLEKVATLGPGQEVLEFLLEDSEIDPAELPGGRSVHLAIDAIEIAHLVGIQIDADGHPAGTTAEDRVDIAVPVKLPPMIVNGQCSLRHTGLP